MKNIIKIPKVFECFGETITIEYDNDRCEEEGITAQTRVPESRIILSDKYRGMIRTPAQIEKALCHELFHTWLIASDYQKMIEQNCNVERFIETMAALLHQYEVTKK